MSTEAGEVQPRPHRRARARRRTFQRDVVTLVRELATAEPLPVTGEEAAQAADELRSLVARCRDMMRVSRETVDELRRQADALSSLTPIPRGAQRDTGRDSYVALAAVAEVTEPLVARAQDLLDRLVATYSIELPAEPPSRPIGPAPMLNPFSPPETIKAAQDAQIKWFVDRFVQEIRPLSQAVNAVFRRSQGWSTPAARQVHLDVTRLRSRLITPEAQRAEPVSLSAVVAFSASRAFEQRVAVSQDSQRASCRCM